MDKKDGKWTVMPGSGKILAELRQDAGMTQQDLAAELNVAKSSISNYETGQRRAHTELICKAAEVFHVSTDYLLGCSDFRKAFSVTEESYSGGTTVGKVLEQMLSLAPNGLTNLHQPNKHPPADSAGGCLPLYRDGNKSVQP